MRIEYTIDELVLIGFEAGDARAIADGIQGRLVAELQPRRRRNLGRQADVAPRALPGETRPDDRPSWITELGTTMSDAVGNARETRMREPMP
jgi:hypothetical protein